MYFTTCTILWSLWYNSFHILLGPAAQEYGVGSTQFQTRGFQELFQGWRVFGWQTVIDMWAREVQTMKANKMTRIPKLKQSYIIRDSWTRLNVAPAKIMQVIYIQHHHHVHTVQVALVPSQVQV